jgi:hypothetical protein
MTQTKISDAQLRNPVDPFVFKASSYGAVADAKKLTDGAITAASAVLSSASASFTAADVGKSVTVIGAGASGASLRTTIISYTSATQVTLTATASTTVSGVVFFFGTDAKAAIQAAINAAIAVKGQAYVSPGSYYISGRMTGGNDTVLAGAGKGKTILLGGAASDYFIYHNATITRFVIQDVTFDVCGLYQASAIQLYYAQQCRLERVEIKNIPSSGWGLKIGVSNGGTDTTICEGNRIIDCDFDTKTGTLEMFLLFNARNTEILRPRFRNNASGPMLGLWQKTYDTRVINPDFYGCAGTCIYYSVTCEDTWITNMYAENCGTGITGSNVSDYGQFGLTRAENVKIINPTLIGGANSTASLGIQLGAVNDALVQGGSIEGYEEGIKISNGNSPASAPATNWRIVDVLIKNCNPTNNFHTLHPAIFVTSGGGAAYGQIKGCNIYDDQATKTQRYPIVFEGSFTWTDIAIFNNRLLGSNINIYKNTDFSGTTNVQSSGALYRTVGSNNADYTTDGVADDVEIQAAITAANVAGGGIVQVKEGTYRITSAISLSTGVRLVGAGPGKTIFRYATGTVSATNMLQLVSGTVRQSDIELTGITFDAQDQIDKGLANLNGIVTNLTVSNCQFLNMSYSASSKWTLRIGAIVDADVEGSASYNVQVNHNLFKNNNCGTFEVILLPNVRDSMLDHNKFEGNSNNGTDEVSIYGQNVNLKYVDNIHKDWSDYAVGAKESDQVEIANNVFSNSLTNASGAIRFFNEVDGAVRDNIITLAPGGTSGGIQLRDYNVGRDGHAQRNVNSYNLDISGNIITNSYYGIFNFTSASSNFNYKYITFDRNIFYNCMKSPFRIGPNSSGLTMDVQYLFLRHNVIHSWSGNIEGAISFYGDTTDATKIKKVFLENNYVANNTTGSSSGAIRLVGATAELIKDNYLTSTGSYGPVSLVSGSTVVRTQGNVGVSDSNNSINSILPSQSGASGKVLQSDGTNVAWGTGSTSTWDVLVTVTADGTTDVSANIQTVLDNLSSSTHSYEVVVVGSTKGTIYLNNKVRITTDNTKVRFRAPIKLGLLSDPDGFGCLSVLGTLQGTTTISSGATRGSSKVVVASTTGLASGRLVRIRDSDATNGSTAGDKGEMAEIVDISGTTLYLDHALHHTYTGTITLENLNPVSNSGFEDVYATFQGQQAEGFVFPMKYYYTRNCFIRNCQFKGTATNSWSRECINTRYSYRNVIHNSSATMSWDYTVGSDYSYGFSIDGSTEIMMTNCWTSNLRHGFAFDRGTAGVIVTGCTCDNVIASGFDLHGNWCRDITYNGCRADSSDTRNAADGQHFGFLAGNTTFLNGVQNIFYNGCVARNFATYTPAGGGSGDGAGFGVVDGSNNIVYQGCRAYDCESGVLVLSQAGTPITNVGIYDCEFSNITSSTTSNPIYINAGVAPQDVNGVVISGCRFIGGDNMSSLLIQGTSGNTLADIEVVNCTWNRSLLVSGTYPINAQFVDRLVVSGNTFNKTRRGVSITSCVSAVIVDNVFNQLVDVGNILADGGGNTSFVFARNHIVGFTPTAVTLTSTTPFVELMPAVRNFTTAARPSASVVRAGAYYYDTTLSKPGFSDGTVWRDSAGTTI